MHHSFCASRNWGTWSRESFDMLGQQTGCARTLICSQFCCRIQHINQVRWERALLCLYFSLSKAYVLDRLDLLDSRDPCMCWLYAGLHAQASGCIVHGSELYINIGIFQSSASARTKDLPTKRPNS